MDPRSGKIYEFGENETEQLKAVVMIPVEPREMTVRQMKTKQVSPFDNRSPLGKRFRDARQSRKRAEQQARHRKAQRRRRARQQEKRG